MQNSTNLFPVRLVCATMIFFCANCGSIFAQDGQKAFNEGDKILTIGLSNGMIGALAGVFLTIHIEIPLRPQLLLIMV